MSYVKILSQQRDSIVYVRISKKPKIQRKNEGREGSNKAAVKK